MVNFFKVAWQRMTTSKVAWMAIPTAFVQIYLAATGVDLGPLVNTIFESLWAAILIFLTINDSGNRNAL